MPDSSDEGTSAFSSDEHDAPCLTCKKTDIREMVQCITCKKWECKGCAGFSDEVYAFLTSNENTIWFCVHCKEGTLETLEAGAQIKKRCQMIEDKYDEKLRDIEVAIESKADKTDLDNVKADQLVHTNQIAGLARDVSNLNKKIDMLAKEPQEKQAREKNIIIRGMPQSENKSDDDLIRDLFADIGLNDLHFTGTTRLGKPAHPPPSNSTNSVDANDYTNTESSSQSDRTLEGDTSQTGVKAVGETKHRPIKITLNSVKDKWKVLESAPKVRTVESNHYNPKKIWIAQDLTKNARQRELDLRKQLNEKRTQDPENRYVIKNGEVVRRM